VFGCVKNVKTGCQTQTKIKLLEQCFQETKRARTIFGPNCLCELTPVQKIFNTENLGTFDIFTPIRLYVEKQLLQ